MLNLLFYFFENVYKWRMASYFTKLLYRQVLPTRVPTFGDILVVHPKQRDGQQLHSCGTGRRKEGALRVPLWSIRMDP